MMYDYDYDNMGGFMVKVPIGEYGKAVYVGPFRSLAEVNAWVDKARANLGRSLGCYVHPLLHPSAGFTFDEPYRLVRDASEVKPEWYMPTRPFMGVGEPEVRSPWYRRIFRRKGNK